MALTDYLTEDHILIDFKASNKTEALKSLCRFAAERRHLPEKDLLKVVLEREESGSTGLGGGVALPHGKSALVDRPLLVLAVAETAIDFDSLDGRPVRILVLLISPLEGEGGEHLKLLARLGGIFKSQTAVEEMLAAATPAEIRAVLAKRE